MHIAGVFCVLFVRKDCRFILIFKQCDLHQVYIVKKAAIMNKENHKNTNRLINETSPYLLQHAHNPVDWHAWSVETLNKAKEKNKMLLISVGYSACHWCHVMERETFENAELAKLMNEHFINIKVDREERPDVDAVYMNAVQLIHGGGGWPLNCFALPDGRPFYGGTYFPPDQWESLLKNIVRLYNEQRDDLEEQARRIAGGLRADDLKQFGAKPGTDVSRDVTGVAAGSMKSRFDLKNGGFKGAPKFPMPNNFLFLLRHGFFAKDQEVIDFVQMTLRSMASGGIYDQLGGGFARYSVDESWKVPHFEKMLYDNAQLISLYVEAFRQSGQKDFLDIAEETAGWAFREMLSPGGLFYAALDADSEGEEGKYYVWKSEEFRAVLGEDAGLFAEFYGIDREGYWEEEKNILVKTAEIADFAKDKDLKPEEFSEKLKKAKGMLYTARESRPKPGLDDKMLVSWNALMIEALTALFFATKKEVYRETAISAAGFILNNLMEDDGNLYHSYQKGRKGVPGFLDDYAFTAMAFLDVFTLTRDESWVKKSQLLAEFATKNFFDRDKGFFWYTGEKSHDLVARKKDIIDNVVPSANSVMASALFRLGKITLDSEYTGMSKKMVLRLEESIRNYPSSFSNWACVYQYFSFPFYEVVVSGNKTDEKLFRLFGHYYPGQILIGMEQKSELPVFKDRFKPDKTLIYVCEGNTCKQPVESAREAIRQMF